MGKEVENFLMENINIGKENIIKTFKLENEPRYY